MAWQEVLPAWRRAYRIINSSFPPLTVFEDTLSPEDLEIAFALEAMTNDRLREEAGLLQRVAPGDRVSGPGSTPVMAAFTHIGNASRFSDGSYGVYYCASSIDAAIAETKFHLERFLAATREANVEITMRAYVNKIVKPVIDVRDIPELHQPDPAAYGNSQAFAREHRDGKAWGLLYRSVRLDGHECVAAFRPQTVSLPVQGPHFRYVWDTRAGAITHILQISEVLV
ncbi:RES family NAD+ phosphorylase [Stutzerimonas stutzeri]|uniref:RES family NAD+ phosphorylase n=1 Tax=Stutzerimonas stutzeri TaxID=316 RepID=UPI0015E486B0|nr:RES family NAD+ phosphorylase [Stutzerimonas stutzeri]MBA1279625.1 RES family NAD+ phosphorylase [Stutzerimonas stutzeri]